MSEKSGYMYMCVLCWVGVGLCVRGGGVVGVGMYARRLVGAQVVCDVIGACRCGSRWVRAVVALASTTSARCVCVLGQGAST